MQKIEGVEFKKENNYAVCYVNYFSEDLKQTIRNDLSCICYGKSDSQSHYSSYSYKNSLKEFVIRYKSKTKEKKMGLIGELLCHIIINTYYPEYIVSSPFFNGEERNVKKGFDLVLYNQELSSITITEVKSGHLHKNKNSTQTSIELLRRARDDLKERLNEKDKQSLWYNAISGAKRSFDNHIDLKNAIIDVLENYHTEAYDNRQTSKNKNVILVSVLFNTLDDKIIYNKVEKEVNRIIKQKKFNSLFCIAIQKQTFELIFDFLEKESM